MKKIGEDLAKMGYFNSKGKVYSQTTMTKFLTNPRYKGFYTAKLTEVEDYKTHKKRKIPKEKQIIEKDNRVPAIVSEELWDKANELYNKRKLASARHILNAENSLNTAKYSCLIYCRHCGNVYIRAGGSNRKINPTWSCKTYKKEGVYACESPILREKYLDKIFVDIFNNFFYNQRDYFKQILNEYENIMENYKDRDDTKQISVIEKQKDKLLDLLLKGIIKDMEFKKRNDKFNLTIEEIQTKLNKISNHDSAYEREIKKINDIKKALVNKMNVKDQLPNLMRLLVEKIEIEKINNDRRYVRLIVYFNFDADIIIKELRIDNKKSIGILIKV